MADLRALIFDFDGTLVRTREASWVVFEKVNARFGLGIDTPAEFYRLFERNMFVALDEACRDAEQAAEVRAYFQELLSREYNPELVPGMASVVRALAGHYTLVVLTTNTMEAVRRVLIANDLAHCFSHVFSGDVFQSKEESIRRFLADASYSCGRRCTPNYDEATVPRQHEPGEVMLITDTVGDVEEALEGGIRASAVAWGMHKASELEEAGAEFVCIWPEELVAYLAPGQLCSTGTCSLPSAASAASGAPATPATANGAPRATPISGVPGEVRRDRRVAAARRTAGRLLGATEKSPGACCVPCANNPAEASSASRSQPAEDPLLREVLEALSGLSAAPLVHTG